MLQRKGMRCGAPANKFDASAVIKKNKSKAIAKTKAQGTHK